MAKFKFEEYRKPWETGPHWELKREFLERYKDEFEEDRLLCLAQLYSNVVLMDCRYPEPVMQEIHELSKALRGHKRFRESICSNVEQDSSERSSGGKRKSSDQNSNGHMKLIKFCDRNKTNEASLDNLDSVSNTQSQLNININNRIITKSEDNSNENILTDSRMIQEKSHTSESAVNACKNEFYPKSVSSATNNLHAPSLKYATLSDVIDSDVSKKQSCIPSSETSSLEECEKLKPSLTNFIKTLGLKTVQRFVQEIWNMLAKNDSPIHAIHSAIQTSRFGNMSFDITLDPKSKGRAPEFSCDFFINCILVSRGKGNSKKKAKSNAAQCWLDYLLLAKDSDIFISADIKKVSPECINSKCFASKDSAYDIDSSVKASSPEEDMEEQKSKVKSTELAMNKLVTATKFMVKPLEPTPQEPLVPSPNKAVFPSKVTGNISESKMQFIFINEDLFHSSIQRNFALIVNSDNEKPSQRNPGQLLAHSAAFCQQSFSYHTEKMLPTPTEPCSYRADVLIGESTISTAVSSSLKEAKRVACQLALENLRKVVYTIKVKIEFHEDMAMKRNQIINTEDMAMKGNQVINTEDMAKPISESNIGCKMLKNMGWTGGGIGKKEGILKPISIDDHRFGRGLGYTDSKRDSRDFRNKVHTLLRNFRKSDSIHDLTFSTEFSKGERKIIHQTASKCGLHSSSHGKGDNRYLCIRRKFTLIELLEQLVKCGGSTTKYELVDESKSPMNH